MTLNPSYFHASQGGQRQPGFSATRLNEARPRLLQGYIKESDQESTSGMFHPVAGGFAAKIFTCKICVLLCESVKNILVVN